MSALPMVIFSGKIVRHSIRNTRKDTFTLVATVIQTRSNHPDLPHQAMELKDKHNISFFLRKKDKNNNETSLQDTTKLTSGRPMHHDK
jgi:hypothetical protein